MFAFLFVQTVRTNLPMLSDIDDYIKFSAGCIKQALQKAEKLWGVTALTNIANSEQSPYTPGSSHHAIPLLLERKKNGHIEGLIYKQYIADSFVHSKTCHM